MRQALDKVSTKILRLVPLILGLVTPLFFLPITVDYFAFNKYFFIAIIGTISLIAWCIRNLTRGKLHLTTSPSFIPLIILVLANIVSSVWLSPIHHVSLFGQTSLFFFFAIIYITVTSSQKNRFSIMSGIYGLIISASLLSLFSLLQYFKLIDRLISSSNLFANFFNPIGGVLPALSFTLPILFATIIFVTGIKKWTLKIALFLSVLLMIIGTIINVSYIFPNNTQQPVISILPLKAGWSIAVDTMKIWQTALLGTGPETFFSSFTRLRPVYLNLNKNIWDIRFSESSNFIFSLITTTGIIGSLAFLLSFLRPLIVSLKNGRNVEEKNIHKFLIVALTTVIFSFFVIPTGIVSLVLGIVLLICLTILYKLENQKSVKDLTISLSADSISSSTYHDLPETAKSSITTSFLPWLITFISVAILSAFWFFGSKIYFGSVAYKQAASLAITDPNLSYINYQEAAMLDTYNPYYPQKLSQIYLSIANAYLSKENPSEDDKKNGTEFAQRSLDAAKISAKLDPMNVTVWENLFVIYRTLIPYAQGSANMAISHGLQAARVDPSNPTIYLQLGTLFYNLGDSDQAIKFFDRTIELKQNWDTPYFNLSSIYKAKKEYAKALQYVQTGLTYTDPNGESIKTVQEEIKALQKLVPPQTATQSAVPQQ